LNTTNYTYEKDEGDITNTMMSGHLQAEYHSDKFRLIGAVRADKFEYPDKTIINPLFATTYNINDDFLVRGSYGRSSRTPFIMDLFFRVDLQYPRIDFSTGNTMLNVVNYRGTERAGDIPGFEKAQYEPLTIDDAQVGFRHKISETFQLDIELFWSKISNLVSFAKIYADTMANLDESVIPGQQSRIDTALLYYSFVNIDAEPTQTGATLSITSAPFKNTTFQIFVTVQQTKVTNYYEALGQNGKAIDADNDGDKYIDDYYHLATPPFYGGFNMNLKPIKKLNLNLNPYFYGHQKLTFGSEYTREAEANIILNAAATYEIMDGMKVFVNGRNLMGNNYRQFAFADKIGATILGGINLEF
jgi:iron complex outermembrane receptor protein